jgi:DNA repair exonuclease SbcCD ATPase subunit
MVEAKPASDIRGTIVANLKKSVALHQYEVVEEADRFLEDKGCAVCKAEFGIIGIVHAKKCLCKFCGRGVCSKCSAEKLMHPTTKKEERICINCLSKMMENHLSLSHKDVKADIEEQKNNHRQMLEIMIKEKQMDMSQNQYLDEQIQLLTSTSKVKLLELKEKVSCLKDSHELIRMNHKKLKEEFERFRQDRDKKISTIENLEKILHEMRQVHEVNQSELPGLRNQVGELQEIEIKLKNQIRTKHGLARSLTLSDKELKIASDFEDLNHKNFVLTEENRIFKDEIQKLQDLNEDIDSQILSQETQASNRINDSLISTSSTKYSPDQEEYIRTLREKSKENQLKIKELRIQLESNKISFVKVKIDTESTPEPGSRPCANCSIM